MKKEVVIDAIGYLAAIIGTFMMMPQAVKAFNTHQVDDLSLTTIIMLVVQCVLWIIFGFGRSIPQVWISNAIALCIGIALLAMKLVWS